jgi:hypothetical protein
MSAMFDTAVDALNFIMSGRAVFTIVSKRTGKRFTYRVDQNTHAVRAGMPDIGFRFVKLLSGPDNENSFVYLGTITGGVYRHGVKSRIQENADSVVAFEWVVRELVAGRINSEKLEIWHEGKCGKCGRRLTVPESIASGLGPECIKTAYRCN